MHSPTHLSLEAASLLPTHVELEALQLVLRVNYGLCLDWTFQIAILVSSTLGWHLRCLLTSTFPQDLSKQFEEH